MRSIIKLPSLLVSAFLAFIIVTGFVTKEEGKTYIMDQTGVKWDVTQAESLGFRPEKFQYGIGMNAFTTLDDSHLSDSRDSESELAAEPDQLPANHRVIGVDMDNEAHAYSVNRLRYHEIANTYISGKAIAAGF